MRTLDRYVIRSFLWTALMFFVVMISLRIVMDLFINMDEFVKVERPKNALVQGPTQAGTVGRLKNIVDYYSFQSIAYVVELGGIIVIASAAFSLARMNHTNELTAMIASGVSLRRVVWPIIASAMVLDLVIFLDQEFVIPHPDILPHLVRTRDGDAPFKNPEVPLMTDSSGAVWYSASLSVRDDQGVMNRPLVTVRALRPQAASSGTVWKTIQVASISGLEGKSYTLDSRSGWLFTGMPQEPAVLRSDRPWTNVPTSRKVWTEASPDGLLAALQKQDKFTAQQTRRVWRIRNDNASAMEEYSAFDASYQMELRYEKLKLGPHVGDKPRDGVLTNPRFIFYASGVAVKDDPRREGVGKEILLGVITAKQAMWMHGDGGYWQLDDGGIFYPTDLSARDMQLRQYSNWLDYMSARDLGELIALRKAPNQNAALLARHIRFTDPINNVIMLLLGLPFILSRERNIKASASLCLLMVSTFYVFIYVCRYMGVPPLLGAWLPSLLFGPIAAVMLDSVKT